MSLLSNTNSGMTLILVIQVALETVMFEPGQRLTLSHIIQYSYACRHCIMQYESVIVHLS